MTAPHQSRGKAAALAIFSVGVASTQDAIVKSVSGLYPAYETVLIRTLTAAPLLLLWAGLTIGLSGFSSPLCRRAALRGLLLCTGYLGFILAIAAMPIANGVAIYFTMPFFVAGLSGPFLKEHVPYYRWIAIAVAFAGIMVMSRLEAGAGIIPSLFALWSALAYAIGQMMGRALSQKLEPLIITNIQNAMYGLVAVVLLLFVNATGIHLTGDKSLEFLTRSFVWPTAGDLALLCLMGVLSSVAAVTFTMAYRAAEASFVAPFEYSAMIWAVSYGWLIFGDFPALPTWIGISIVVLAGIYMAINDQRQKLRVTAPDNPPNP